jgi:hypothetical protein
VGCELYPTSSLLRMNACNSGQSVDAMTSTFFNQFGAIDISPVAIAPGTSRSITMLPEQVPPGQVAIARELAVKVKNNAAHPGNHGWFIGGQATL